MPPASARQLPAYCTSVELFTHSWLHAAQAVNVRAWLSQKEVSQVGKGAAVPPRRGTPRRTAALHGAPLVIYNDLQRYCRIHTGVCAAQGEPWGRSRLGRGRLCVERPTAPNPCDGLGTANRRGARWLRALVGTCASWRQWDAGPCLLTALPASTRHHSAIPSTSHDPHPLADRTALLTHHQWRPPPPSAAGC